MDSKIERYHHNVTGFRDKILGGIGVLITILLAFASMDIMRTSFIVTIVALVIIGIIVYFVVDRIIYHSNIAFFMIKGSRLRPILSLLALKECLVLSSLVKDTSFNYLNLFNFIKLVGMAKFQLLAELKSASENRRLYSLKYHYKSLASTEEELISRALEFYESVKEQLSSDDIVKLFDEQISNTFGGETIMEMYSRLSASRTPLLFHEKITGLIVSFPSGWLIDEKRKTTRIIVSARPKSESSGTHFTISRLDVSNELVYPTKSLDEVVKFQLNYIVELENSTSIIEKSNTQIAGFDAYKIVYSVHDKSLVDVGTKVWVVMKGKAYEIEFITSNKLKFEYYQNDVLRILDSIHVEENNYIPE